MPNSALTNSTELLQIVAILVPGLQPARHQIVGETVGVALQLGIADLPRAVGQRDAVAESPRRFAQESPIATRPIRPGPGTPPVAARLLMMFPLNYWQLLRLRRASTKVVIPGCALSGARPE